MEMKAWSAFRTLKKKTLRNNIYRKPLDLRTRTTQYREKKTGRNFGKSPHDVFTLALHRAVHLNDLLEMRTVIFEAQNFLQRLIVIDDQDVGSRIVQNEPGQKTMT